MFCNFFWYPNIPPMALFSKSALHYESLCWQSTAFFFFSIPLVSLWIKRLSCMPVVKPFSVYRAAHAMLNVFTLCTRNVFCSFWGRVLKSPDPHSENDLTALCAQLEKLLVVHVYVCMIQLNLILAMSFMNIQCLAFTKILPFFFFLTNTSSIFFI